MKFFNKFKVKLKERKKKLLEKRLKKQTKHFQLGNHLAKAGIAIQTHILSRGLFRSTLVVNLILTVFFLLFFAKKQGFTLPYVILILILVWTLVFAIFLGLIWLAFYLFLDLRIFNRKLSMEEVLPDFLYLAATNIRSGMTVDKALWFAVRGMLSKNKLRDPRMKRLKLVVGTSTRYDNFKLLNLYK